jgi:hypothetical protein
MPEPTGIDVDLSGSLEDVERELSQSYDDPVRSRILEAVRAKIVTEPRELGGTFTLKFALK